MLPPIVIGGPETVEVKLNCQLPSTFGPDEGGGEVTPPVPPGPPLVVPWYPAPPHPQSRTSADSRKMFAQRFMMFLLQTVAAIVECRQRATASMSPEQKCAAGNCLIRGVFGLARINKIQGRHFAANPTVNGAICMDRVVPKAQASEFPASEAPRRQKELERRGFKNESGTRMSRDCECKTTAMTRGHTPQDLSGGYESGQAMDQSPHLDQRLEQLHD
jgi:hypothetical protein